MTENPIIVTHAECAYFPCHDGVDRSAFNCLFCFCPLYPLGAECGGSFYYSESGIKCCDKCDLPHRGEEGVRHVHAKIGTVIDLMREEPCS